MKALFWTVIITVAVVAGLSTGLSAQDKTAKKNDRGRLCKIYKVELASSQPGGRCDAPAYINEGGECVTATYVHNAFSYIINPDESLEFGLSYWFDGGHHCGITGHASRTAKGWRYENAMDKGPNEACGVTISIEYERVFFDADQNASCRMECGAQAYLDATSIPLDALEHRNVTAKSFEPEVFYNTPCQSAPP